MIAIKNGDNGTKISIGRTAIARARKRSNEVDSIVIELFNNAVANNPGKRKAKCALIAIGGYGRQELSPQSDLDLLVLYSGPSELAAKDIAKAIFYPLWDAGYHVGHSVHSLRTALRSATADIDLLTAALDARHLAGDEEIFAMFKEGTVKHTKSKNGRPFLTALKAKNAERYLKYGDSARMLEPDIKNGCGGLRDVQSMIWAGQALREINSLHDLQRDKLLDNNDALKVKNAREFLMQVRENLHLISNRPVDTLSFDYQENVADSMGYKGGKDILAVEQFMRDYYLHANNIEFAVKMFWMQLNKNSALGPRKPLGTRLRALGHKQSSDESETILHIFADVAVSDIDISAETLHNIVRFIHGKDRVISWTVESRNDFLDILATGNNALTTLETLMHIGVLEILIPEFANVRCRPQHGAYHRYTIDSHSFHTVAELGKVGQGLYSNLLPLDVLYQELEDKGPLLLAGLLHDIGKGFGKNHAAKGAGIAGEIVARAGFESHTQKAVVFLIRNHLLLVETAIRRDINDENLIFDIAAKIQDASLLKMLYLLTVADGLATGPEAWNAWKSTLVRELFFKLLHVLERGEARKDIIDSVKKRKAELKALLSAKYPVDDIGAYIEAMPRPYILSNPAESISKHFELLQGLLEKRLRIAYHREPDGVYEFTFIAADRPGLFSTVAGILSLNGVNILSANVYSSVTGFALEVFKVKGLFDSELDENKWKNIEGDLKKIPKGKVSLEERLVEMMNRYGSKTQISSNSASKVIIDNDTSDFYTVIEVHASDRPGLLHDVTRAIYEMGLDIHLAKAATGANQVVDAFYVRSVTGEKITEDEEIENIKSAIFNSLKSKHLV